MRRTPLPRRGGEYGIIRRRHCKPIIAAAEGLALGRGTEIALACDLVVASRTARFGLPEVQRSLVPIYGGLFRSLRALARVSYAGPEGKHGFEEAVLVQRPDRLRLETLTLMGAILIVTANDKEIIGYHPREGVLVRGRSSKENLLRYTQIPLELDEITALLLGLAPVEPSAGHGARMAIR